MRRVFNIAQHFYLTGSEIRHRNHREIICQLQEINNLEVELEELLLRLQNTKELILCSEIEIRAELAHKLGNYLSPTLLSAPDIYFTNHDNDCSIFNHFKEEFSLLNLELMSMMGNISRMDAETKKIKINLQSNYLTTEQNNMLVMAQSSMPNIDSIVAHFIAQVKNHFADSSFSLSDESKTLLNNTIKSSAEIFAETLYSNESTSIAKRKLDGMMEHYQEVLKSNEELTINLDDASRHIEALEEKIINIPQLERLVDEQRTKILGFEQELKKSDNGLLQLNLNQLRRSNEEKTNTIARLEDRVMELEAEIEERKSRKFMSFFK